MTHAIAHGDVLEALKGLPDNSFDASLFDPPYGFRFMRKAWDYEVPSKDVFAELLRVLKPGAPILSFGGSRTFHRVACNIEDAGAELRDCLMWLYGKGFPKSANVAWLLDKAAGVVRKSHEPPVTPIAKQWSKHATALKPAWEPIILARKPLEGSIVDGIVEYACGPLAIDACRIGLDGGTAKVNPPKGKSNGTYGDGLNGTCEIAELDAGRWPANLVFDEEAAAALDAQVGEVKSRKSITRNGGGNAGGDVFVGRKTQAKPDSGYEDAGGPSRFFYCAKVSQRERELGCEHLPKKSAGECTDREDGSAGLDNPRAGAGRTGGAHNHHPTLKPIALTKWLATLVKPPTADATLLVPYSGAGSEMIGALLAGWPFVFGIEGDADYVQIAHARIAAWVK